MENNTLADKIQEKSLGDLSNSTCFVWSAGPRKSLSQDDHQINSNSHHFLQWPEDTGKKAEFVFSTGRHETVKLATI